MACEIPLLFPRRKDFLSQRLADKGTLFHADLKTLRLTVEAKWRSFQGQGFSEVTIKTILSATRDTSRVVYKGRWESFISLCGERGQNPIRVSLIQVLDFLQGKAETLAVNMIKGYVTAISCRHAIVRGTPLSMNLMLQRWII